METLLENDQERCEHPLHCLILVDADYENPMDKAWITNSATLKCIKCGKKITFFTKCSAYYSNYYRDGKLVETE